MDGDSDQSATESNADNQMVISTSKEEQQSILQKTSAAQEAEIKKLQRDLNESRVKHGKEVYWLRLELDSSRRDKEAAEDRTTELFHDLQEILEQPTRHSDDADVSKTKVDSADICTEPDYVAALQDRISAYAKSVEVFTSQIDMLKTSSEAVMTSMKEEVNDLMEEKSLMEMDLLNQISDLDNEKRDLEVRLLSASSDGGKAIDDSRDISQLQAPIAAAAGDDDDDDNDNDDDDSSFRTSSPVVESTSSSTSKHSVISQVNADDLHPIKDDRTTQEGTPPEKSSKRAHEISFRSTTMTEGSSFTNINTASVHTSAYLNDTEEHILELQRLNTKHRREAQHMAKEKRDLQEKIKEITRELMYTKSSASVALALDKIKTDRAETLAHLDRISVLWGRADSTVLVLEGLLSQAQPGTTNSHRGVHNLANEDGQGQILSAFETAAVVHGEIKLSLTHIELTFRNHLTSIQEDRVQRQEPDETFCSQLDKVRSETLRILSQAEDKWGLAIEDLEKQILVNSKTTGDAMQLQLEEIQNAQAAQELLEAELNEIKRACRTPEKDTQTGSPSRDKADQNVSLGGKPASGGIFVSPDVLARLQREVQSVVERLKEKNELIESLADTLKKQKRQLTVLKKEQKRLKQSPETSTKRNTALTTRQREETSDSANGAFASTAAISATETTSPPPPSVASSSARRKQRQKEIEEETEEKKVENADDDVDYDVDEGDTDTSELLLARNNEESRAQAKGKGSKDHQAKKTLWPFLPRTPARRSGKGISTSSPAKSSLSSEPNRRSRKAMNRRDGVNHFSGNRGWSSL